MCKKEPATRSAVTAWPSSTSWHGVRTVRARMAAAGDVPDRSRSAGAWWSDPSRRNRRSGDAGGRPVGNHKRVTASDIKRAPWHLVRVLSSPRARPSWREGGGRERLLLRTCRGGQGRSGERLRLSAFIMMRSKTSPSDAMAPKRRRDAIRGGTVTQHSIPSAVVPRDIVAPRPSPCHWKANSVAAADDPDGDGNQPGTVSAECAVRSGRVG